MSQCFLARESVREDKKLGLGLRQVLLPGYWGLVLTLCGQHFAPRAAPHASQRPVVTQTTVQLRYRQMTA